MKPLLSLLIVTLCLGVPVEAAQNKNQNKEKEKEAEKKKEKEERARKRAAIEAIVTPKDKNRDGSLTKDEYLSDETDKEAAGKRFDQYNKNGDRYLTKGEIEDSLGG